jgi:hypothetical protein
MSLHECKCKLCHKPLTIEIDDAYAELGDPFKMLPTATCNRCFDLRERRIRIEGQVARASRMLIMQPKMDAAVRNKIRDGLRVATQAYARYVADLNFSGQIAWNEEFVDIIMEQPQKSLTALSIYRNNRTREIQQSRK